MSYESPGSVSTATAFGAVLAGLAALIAAVTASPRSMFVGGVLALVLGWRWMGSFKRGRIARLLLTAVTALLGASLLYIAVHGPLSSPNSPKVAETPNAPRSNAPASPRVRPSTLPRLPAPRPPAPLPAPSPSPSLRPEPPPAPSGGVQEWADSCPSDPGLRAPRWARDRLHALYLGGMRLNADPPPGITGGCTGPPIFPSGHDEGFVYVEGRDSDGELKSVAVVSKLYGSGLFIAPAAKSALALIKMFHDIGGMRRTNAGDGQVYGVKTPLGTAILMRSGTMLGDGSGRAQDYLMLRPAAAALWWRAVQDYGSWLWALSGGKVDGKQRIVLMANLLTRARVKTIVFDPATGSARFDRSSRWCGPEGIAINQEQLESYAGTALGSTSGSTSPDDGP
jgi:hypothetical protein